MIVVNVDRGEPYDVYGGRSRPGEKPNPIANPHHIGIHGTRAEVIEAFEKHARLKMRTDPAFVELLRSLKGKRVGCHCTPRPCHLDVLKRLVEELTS
jgi:hypothetical protein